MKREPRVVEFIGPGGVGLTVGVLDARLTPHSGDCRGLLILIDGLGFHRIVEKGGGVWLVIARDVGHVHVRQVGGGDAGTFSGDESFLNCYHNLKSRLLETVVEAG